MPSPFTHLALHPSTLSLHPLPSPSPFTLSPSALSLHPHSLPSPSLSPFILTHSLLSIFVLKEHIIWRWGDTTPVFHNKLVQIYQKKVEDLLAKYKAKNKGTCRRVSAVGNSSWSPQPAVTNLAFDCRSPENESLVLHVVKQKFQLLTNGSGLVSQSFLHVKQGRGVKRRVCVAFPGRGPD